MALVADVPGRVLCYCAAALTVHSTQFANYLKSRMNALDVVNQRGFGNQIIALILADKKISGTGLLLAARLMENTAEIMEREEKKKNFCL